MLTMYMYTLDLTQISLLASSCWTHAYSVDPDQTPQDAASGQGLHCLLTICSIKTLPKNEKYHPTTLKMEIELSN